MKIGDYVRTKREPCRAGIIQHIDSDRHASINTGHHIIVVSVDGLRTI